MKIPEKIVKTDGSWCQVVSLRGSPEGFRCSLTHLFHSSSLDISGLCVLKSRALGTM